MNECFCTGECLRDGGGGCPNQSQRHKQNRTLPPNHIPSTHEFPATPYVTPARSPNRDLERELLLLQIEEQKLKNDLLRKQMENAA